jgi:hypothetical protein
MQFNKDLRMQRTSIVRSFTDDSRAFFIIMKGVASLLVRIVLDKDRPGFVRTKEVYSDKTANILSVTQSADDPANLYILDDSEQVVHLTDKDTDGQMTILGSKSLDQHSLGDQMVQWHDQPWLKVIVDENAICIEGKTYSLVSKLRWVDEAPHA